MLLRYLRNILIDKHCGFHFNFSTQVVFMSHMAGWSEASVFDIILISLVEPFVTSQT